MLFHTHTHTHRPGASKMSVVRRSAAVERRKCARSALLLGGVWGHGPPRKFLNFRRSQINSSAFWGTLSLTRYSGYVKRIILIKYNTIIDSD